MTKAEEFDKATKLAMKGDVSKIYSSRNKSGVNILTYRLIKGRRC